METAVREKTNFVASSNKPPVELNASQFIDGSPITPDGGGIVATNDGEYYSVSRIEMTPNGSPAYVQDGNWVVPASRAGRISLLTSDVSLPTTHGVELEATRLKETTGEYADLPTDHLLKVNELYTFMDETGTQPTDDPLELERRFWEMINNMVDDAELADQLVAVLSVYAQNEPTTDQLTPSPYVRHVVNEMFERTGFDAVKFFRVGSDQTNTGLSNTHAGLQALEAMQYLSPILYAPTLSGPLLHGGQAGNLASMQFDPKQQAHLDESGILRSDLSGPYLSWRYLLRRIASPSGCIWAAPPAEGIPAFLLEAHKELAAGQINNVDRTNGWHTDRLRAALDGKGANTDEDCSGDTMLGNPESLVPLHLLRSALTTRLEAMALEGKSPVEAVAKMLGTASLSRQARLDLAHRQSLNVSRHGNDALTYEGRKPGQWLGALLEIANEAPYTQLTSAQQHRLRGMYATWAQTEPELKRWCAINDQSAPTPQAYFDLVLNNPAVYMRAQHSQLKSEHPDWSEEQVIRQVELNAGQALHQASRQHRNI